MPLYCYTNELGETIEEMYDIGAAPCMVTLDQKIYRRDFAAEHPPVARKSNSGAEWPRASTALGVGTHQVDEAYASSVASGVPTEFDRRTGDAIVTSPSHQKALAKSLGYIDKSSYG